MDTKSQNRISAQHLKSVFDAGYKNGALGVFLSGSGPSVAAFVRPGMERRVGNAMLEALTARRVKGEILNLTAETRGATIERR